MNLCSRPFQPMLDKPPATLAAPKPPHRPRGISHPVSLVIDAYHRVLAERALPMCRQYARLAPHHTNSLATLHDAYIREVSSGAMAMSLEAATFLACWCDWARPKRVVDLGSGFSSLVVRLYAARTPGVEVWSVDDDSYWLQRTAACLRVHSLPQDNLCTWSEWRERHDVFDLIVHDLGSMSVRAEALALVLKRVEPQTGVVILDDMHKRRYAGAVAGAMRDSGYRLISLRPYTLDVFGRYASLTTNPESRRLESTEC